MRPSRVFLLFFLSFGGGASGAAAAAPADARDDGARMERIAEGVYVIIHDDATDQWPHSNTGVVIGDAGVFVVDSTYLPSRARADIALIKSVTSKPVRYLATTHWHFDHNNGAVAYRDAYPGVKLVSERDTARYVTLNQTWWARMSTAQDSARRTSLAELETSLAAGKDKDGKALTDEEKRTLPRAIAQRKAELVELATLEVVEPTLLFDDVLTLDLDGRRIELRNWGRANSPADVTVYLPREQVLFTGDIVVQAPLPYTGASWPLPWIGVLRGLEAVPAQVIVPGHGPVMRDHGYVRRVRTLMEAVVARVEAMVREGKTLDQIQATLDLGDLRKGFAPWAGASDDDWNVTMKVLIERAFRGVRGQG
jgi:cyclase